MKELISILLAVVGFTSQAAFPYLINTNTVGGDSGQTGGSKINANFTELWRLNSYWTNKGHYMGLSVTNDIVVTSNALSSRLIGTNNQLISRIINATNKLDTDLRTLISSTTNSIGTNYILKSGGTGTNIHLGSSVIHGGLLFDEEGYQFINTSNAEIILKWYDGGDLYPVWTAANQDVTFENPPLTTSATVGPSRLVNGVWLTNSVINLISNASLHVLVVTNYNGTNYAPLTTNIPPIDTKLGMFAQKSFILEAGTNITLSGAITDYTNQLSGGAYMRILTNGFTGVLDGNVALTNLYAGYYWLEGSTTIVATPDNDGDEIEGEFFFNGVGQEFLSDVQTLSNGSRTIIIVDGIAYIPANTAISFKLKNQSDASCVLNITRAKVLIKSI